MKPCVNCRIFKPEIKFTDLLEVVDCAGFTAVELRIECVSDYLLANSVDDAKTDMESKNITAASFIDILPPGLLALEGEYKDAYAKIKDKCVIAEALDCTNASITINPRTAMSWQQAHDVAVTRLRQIAAIAGDFDIVLAIEPLGVKQGISARLDGPMRFVDRISEAVSLMSETESCNVKLLLDVFHWYLSGGSLDEIESVPADSISLVHVSDAPSESRESIQDKDRLTPGKGVIEILSALRASKKTGFDGFVSLELFNLGLGTQDPLLVANEGREQIQELLQNL